MRTDINKLKLNYDESLFWNKYSILKLKLKVESDRFDVHVTNSLLRADLKNKMVSYFYDGVAKVGYMLFLQEKRDELFSTLSKIHDIVFEEVDSISSKVMASLFLNSLNGTVTGELVVFSMNRAKNKTKIGFNISVLDDLVLRINVNSFTQAREDNIKIYNRYKQFLRYKELYSLVYTNNIYTFKKVPFSNKLDLSKLYIKQNKYGKNDTIFYSFVSPAADSNNEYSKVYKNFDFCRCYYLGYILESVNDFFADISLTLAFESIDFETYSNSKSTALWKRNSSSDLQLMYVKLNVKGINIVNKCHLDGSEDYGQYLVDAFLDSYFDKNLLVKLDNVVLSDKLDMNRYNIVIVHEKDRYKFNKDLDPHMNYDTFVVNHMTPEVISSAFSSMSKKAKDSEAILDISFLNVFTELIMKEDIQKGELSFAVDDISLDDRLFVYKYSVEKEDGIEFVTVYKMTLDGTKMNFETLMLNSLCDDELKFVTELKTKGYSYGIIYGYNKILINETLMMPLPEIKETKSALIDNYNASYLIDYDAISDFKADSDFVGQAHDFDSWCNLLKLTRGEKAKFFWHIFDKTGVFVTDRFLRNEQAIKKFYASLLGISYAEISDRLCYYWVGLRKGFSGSLIEKAPLIREVYYLEGDRSTMEELFFKFLDVEFVRIGQICINPFFIKYINEYIKINN